MRIDTEASGTGELIRRLVRRQWAVLLAIVAVALGSLFIDWRQAVKNREALELVNLAGRQGMLLQHMAMFLELEEYERDANQQRHYRDAAIAAAGDYAEAHARLTAIARELDPDSPIRALYFGPAGDIDAKSARYLALVQAATADSPEKKAIDGSRSAAILGAAAPSLLAGLQRIVDLYQRDAEENIELRFRLRQIAALLIVGLVSLGMFGVFRPLLRRLANDVAARDRAERELKESEERFKAFSESSSDWFWETDAQHRFSWFQESATVQNPFPIDRILGRTRMELRFGHEIAAVEKWRAHQADLDAHRPFRDFEYQLGPDFQAARWVSVSGQPRFDASGEFLGYRGTARFIQAQKDAEASLLRLQTAIEQSPVSIMIIDAGWQIIYVNAFFCAISGYGKDHVIGRVPRFARSADTREMFADIDQAMAEGRVWRGELCSRKRSGELYWESVSISPVEDHRGAITHYIAVSQDITAQRQADLREQGRKQILEAVAGGAPLQDVLKLIVAMGEAELPGGLCAIQRLDRLQGKLFNACAPSLSKSYIDAIEGLQIGPGVGSCGTAAATATRIVAADIDSHPYWRDCRALAAAEDLRACWSQPILSSAGQVLGTLAIYYRTPRSPGAEEIQIVELLASLSAICLERDEAEQALRQQEEQSRRLLAEHQTILNNAMVGIVYLKQRRVISCNRRLEQIFGYAPGELIGESSERFYASRETFETIGDEAYRSVTASNSYSTELLLKHKDGSVFRGALTGRAIDPARPHEGSIWVYADISERYRAEQQAQKLLQAVEQSPVSIVITDREGLIEYVNPRFTKVAGYSAGEALGQNPRILQSGETPAETYRQLWQTLLAGREWRGILRNRRKNGELFWEEASISPIVDDKGETTHYIAVKEDITERKRIEDELEQHRAHLEDLVEQRTADLSAALEAAKAADQAKDAFLAHVSHELRTPLNAVIGLSELARRISTDPRQQDYLDKAVGAGRTLTGIINDLLDLSKISASRMELERTTFSLRALVQRSRSVMAHRAAEKGLELIERIDPAVPDVLLGDPMRIEQILLNLLSNAIKFTPAGRVELRIAVDAREEHRVCLVIEVEDSGIGLAEEAITRLFKPFAQADASMNRRFGGTGLGLALCKRLAEMMGGDIGVSSRVGVGTTFRVRVWVGLGDAADLPEVARAGGRHALPESYRDAKVLVVDDQPINREIVEALLAQVGIAPRCAANGREALDILRESGPGGFDLVLMDIQMPVIDGLAATREIRGWPGFAELPIIAMTAHTLQHEKELSAATGMNDHIGKPFEAGQFFDLLARWIPEGKQQISAASPAPTLSARAGLASLASIDTQAGLARFVGNEERYRHWLRDFVAAAPDYVPQIRRHLAAGEAEAARQAAHAIKGRVGMLGMRGLHPVASALEAALMHGAPAAELLDRLQGMIDAMCAEIHAALGASEGEKPAPPAAQAHPRGPLTGSIARLIGMLQSADGGSAAAIEACLAEPCPADWAPRLQQALAHLRRFDFDAAGQALAAGERNMGN